MKFQTKASAVMFAKLRPAPNGYRHEVVRTRYWSNDYNQYLPGWTIVLVEDK